MPDRTPTALTPIGAGNTRDCFAHPFDPALCIKVPVNAQGEKVCRREHDYLTRVERRFPDADLRRLPRYLGRVLTDRGHGWVQQRVLDADGTPSGVLGAVLDAQRYAAAPARWDRALAEFIAWAVDVPVSLRDLTPTNLCVRLDPDGELQIVPIDGFSPRAVLPRLLPTRRYAAQRNRRELDRFGFRDVPTMLACARARGDTVRPERQFARDTRLLSVELQVEP